MSIPLPFANNTIQVYAYEGFDYLITNPGLGTLQTVSNSTGLNPSSLYFTKNGDTSYRFSISDLQNKLTAGTTEQFVLSTSDPLVSSNIVQINPGRFLDGSGSPLSNAAFTFFKNEPITKIRLVAPSFALKPPTSIPSLPPGLSFVNVTSNSFDISGIPLVTVPTSNYQIIGAQNGGSKVITTRFNLGISNERLRTSVTNPAITGMQIGSAITPRTLTSIPPVGTSVVRYTFPTLPDGISVRDKFGAVQTSPFFPTDASYTLVVAGTPTSNTAYSFRDGGSNGLVYNVLASRTVPTPLVELVQPFQFAFGETVLFDLTSVQSLYVGTQLVVGENSFRAQTYFTSNVGISSISAASLPDGLSLSHVPGSSTANLIGTPSTVSSANYTIQATNSNGVTRSFTTQIRVLSDSVAFSSPTDVSYTFILSRPLDQPKEGYYPANIRFIASASSGKPVTLSAPALVGTGLSLSSSGVLTGLPNAVTPVGNLDVIATVPGSPATATKRVSFSILNDVFTFADVSASTLAFVQNVPIVPFQFPVATLSGRNVIDYVQSGLPRGTTINPAGIVSGTPTASTPTSGVVEISATTGFSSGLRNFNYTLTPDSILTVVSPTQFNFVAGSPIVGIDFNSASYSGRTVSNYQFSINPAYGMVIDSNTGVVSGTWSSGFPPEQLFRESRTFTVTAQAGTITNSVNATLTANPIVRNVALLGLYGTDASGNNLQTYLSYKEVSDGSSNFPITTFPTPLLNGGGIADIQFKNNNPQSNVFIASGGRTFYRGTSLANVTSNTFVVTSTNDYESTSQISSVTHSTNGNWFFAGRFGSSSSYSVESQKARLFRSVDDGISLDTTEPSLIVDSNNSNAFMRTRDGGGDNFLSNSNPYLNGGVALKYKDGILMAGGLDAGAEDNRTSIMRSVDYGVTWSQVNDTFLNECAYFNFDHPAIWIATGSVFSSKDYETYMGVDVTANTIRYSTDQGLTWTKANGGFSVFGYEIAYGNNTWVATGVSTTTDAYTSVISYSSEVRFSTDGSNWSVATLSSSPLANSTSNAITAPLRIGSLNFDGTNWNVFVNKETAVSGSSNSTFAPFLFTHNAISSLANGWSGLAIPLPLATVQGNSNLRFLSVTPPKYFLTGDPPINIGLSVSVLSGTGPTFTAPSNRSFLEYQYIPIAPVEISAQGTGTVYIFLPAEGLPPGLRFDPTTRRITGIPAQIGTFNSVVYAKDNLGVSVLSLSFNIIIPRIIRSQDGAGAYTSLLRQYTEVLGAQNARDNRVLPNEERSLGEFMSPHPPDVITQTIDPKCRNPNC